MCTWVFISSPPHPYPSLLALHLSLRCILWLILPLFNTALAEPITLSPLPLPRADNPLPGLIEGDCISAGSRAAVVLKWRDWKQSDASLHPYQCAINTQPLLLSQPRSHFPLSLLSPRRGQNASWSQKESTNCQRGSQKKEWMLCASSSLWLGMWVRQQWRVAMSFLSLLHLYRTCHGCVCLSVCEFKRHLCIYMLKEHVHLPHCCFPKSVWRRRVQGLGWGFLNTHWSANTNFCVCMCVPAVHLYTLYLILFLKFLFILFLFPQRQRTQFRRRWALERFPH